MNLDNFKREVEENPIAAIAVGALAATAVAKLLNSFAASRNSRTWRREVNRRVRKGK